MRTSDIEVCYKQVGDKYVLTRAFTWNSCRYHKTVTCPAGMESDGASGPAIDIVSVSWWVHDRVCETAKWDDGSKCNHWQRSMILHDILKDEGRWFRAKTWGLFTFMFE